MTLLLHNGLIYPGYRTRCRPSAVAIKDARIVAIGTDDHLIGEFPKARRVNLDGRTVIPGLIDSHTHFYFWALSLARVYLFGLPSYEAVLEKIKGFASTLKPDEWVTGEGWAMDSWTEYRLPTAEDLDTVTGGRPAFLYSKDQHSAWVNSAAMRRAGITAKTKDPIGGKIERDPATGRPTGILREPAAYSAVMNHIPQKDQKEIDTLWKKVETIARSRGVTGFHSFDGPDGWEYFCRRHEDGNLGFRVTYYFPVKRSHELAEKGLTTGYGDDNLNIGGVKIFADGALGSRTALMKQPYQNSREVGVAVTDPDELTSQVAFATKHDLNCAVHAIGDQAVANVLTAFEKAGRKRRHRIEHVQIIDRRDIALFKRLGVVASMQPSHCPSDRIIVDRHWGRRGKNAYIFKTLLKRGIPLAFGSDCPIEPLHPLEGIHAAVNRNAPGERSGKFYPEEALSVTAAVTGFTSGAAYAAGREDHLGKISPGYLADLVVLEDNIFTMALSQIHQARISMTVFDGKIVHRRRS